METELKRPLLGSRNNELVAWGVTLFGFDANESPFKLDALEEIDNLLAFLQTNCQVFLLRGFAYFDSLGVGTDSGAEVDFGCIVDLVSRHAIGFFYDQSECLGARLEDVTQGCVEIVSDGVWYEIVGHGSEKHDGSCHGSVGREQ